MNDEKPPVSDFERKLAEARELHFVEDLDVFDAAVAVCREEIKRLEDRVAELLLVNGDLQVYIDKIEPRCENCDHLLSVHSHGTFFCYTGADCDCKKPYSARRNVQKMIADAKAYMAAQPKAEPVTEGPGIDLAEARRLVGEINAGLKRLRCGE